MLELIILKKKAVEKTVNKRKANCWKGVLETVNATLQRLKTMPTNPNTPINTAVLSLILGGLGILF